MKEMCKKCKLLCADDTDPVEPVSTRGQLPRATGRQGVEPTAEGHHLQPDPGKLHHSGDNRALYRIKLLPVTHVLVDMWLLTVKPIHKL